MLDATTILTAAIAGISGIGGGYIGMGQQVTTMREQLRAERERSRETRDFPHTRGLLPQRGHGPSPTHHGGGLRGVRQGGGGPFPRSPKTCCYAGESPWGVRDSRPLGAGGLVCLFADGRSTATTGIALAPPIQGWQGSNPGLAGVQDGDYGPLPAVPRTGCYAGESPWGP
jgi:hypothetical protein